uniref:Uncharacterized protein n=1 Tax=Ciona savignyi TaxID=51511 RepID=H2YDL8_CIOSA
MGVVLSNGLRDLTDKMEYRIDNEKRKLKRKQPAQSEKPYGCNNWCPVNENETDISPLLQLKDWLKQEYLKTIPNLCKVQKAMRETFPLQQRDINNKPPMSVANVKIVWPFLLQEECLIQYYSISTDKRDAKSELMHGLTSKSALVYRHMKKSN